MLLLILLLLLVFGFGGGYAWGGTPYHGGISLGGVLLIILLLWALGVFGHQVRL